MVKTEIKMFLISNMYPSKQNVRYGIFVKNFEDAIGKNFVVEKIVMTKKFGIINKLMAYFKLYYKILLLLTKAKREDLIYVHFPLHVAPVLLLLLFRQSKIVLNFHGSDLIFQSNLTKLLSVFLIPLIKKSSIVVPSNYFREKLINEFDVSNSRIFVYPSGGINRKIFYPKKRIIDQNFTIGFVSNFIPEKGWEIFLGAIKIIIEGNLIRNLEIIMVGDGIDKRKIDHIVSTMNIDVQFFTNQTQDQLARIYNKLDIFIFPTFRESLGLVGIEAMSCGVPVIASNVDGPNEYIKKAVNGFLFEKQNTQDLVDKILIYHNLSKTNQNIMSKNCEQTASLYDCLKVKGSMINFLNHIG